MRSFPGTGGKWQISNGGGLYPLWSRDGRELLFLNLDQRVMAVGYSVKIIYVPEVAVLPREAIDKTTS